MLPVLFCFCFIFVVFGGYSPPNPTSPPLPCPTPEDRDIASYTNGTCSGRYSCCFDEQVMDPISGNFSTMSCCYAYGATGPYKCCGRSPDHSELIFLLFALPPLPFIFLIFYCCCKACGSDNRQHPVLTKSVNSAPEPVTPDPESGVTDPEPINTDSSIELETIIVESNSSVELED